MVDIQQATKQARKYSEQEVRFSLDPEKFNASDLDTHQKCVADFVRGLVPLLLRSKPGNLPDFLFDFLLAYKDILCDYAIEEVKHNTEDNQKWLSRDNAFGNIICTHRIFGIGQTDSEQKIRKQCVSPSTVAPLFLSFIRTFKSQPRADDVELRVLPKAR